MYNKILEKIRTKILGQNMETGLRTANYYTTVSIAFLQETYSSKAQENIWSAEWGGKIYFIHGSKHSKGVAILCDPKLSYCEERDQK